MRAMIVATFCALAVSAHAQQPSAGYGPIATARAVCADGAGALDRTRELAAAHGWTPMQDDSAPHLQAALRLSQSLAATTERTFFAHDQTSGTLLITAGPQRLGCFVYDFDAASFSPEAEISDWLGMSPSATDTVDGGLWMVRWDGPTALNGAVGVGATFITPDSRAEEELGFQGAMVAVVWPHPR